VSHPYRSTIAPQAECPAAGPSFYLISKRRQACSIAVDFHIGSVALAARSVSPASDLLQEGLALISCQRVRFAEGAELARRSLASDPKQARSHVILGRALHALGRHDGALSSFDRAIARRQETPRSFNVQRT
jgi:tetratricopeptide (TPR) repeat protein